MRVLPGRFARQPQSVWLRRALFQVHLWTGIGTGIYVLLVSLSGSAIVFRRETDKALCPRHVTVTPSGRRMTDQELASAAHAAYPRFKIEEVQVQTPGASNAAVEIWLISGARRLERLFDPYTGEDFGDTVACEPDFITWLVDFHADLLHGDAGRLVNGLGAILLTLVCMTGAIIWWPGTARWRQSMTIRRNADWRRFIWDLHSMLGFWMLLFITMWAVTGIYLAFPEPFIAAADLFRKDGEDTALSGYIDGGVEWLVRLHFGRAYGLSVKALWVILGIAPAAMFVTGALMWWNRIVRRSKSAILTSPP